MMSNLFDQIVTNGSGSMTEAQFMQAFQSMNPPQNSNAQGAAAVWAQLDPNNTGQVSKQDFINGMTALMKQMRTGHHHGGHHLSSQAASSQAAPSQVATSQVAPLQTVSDSTSTLAATIAKWLIEGQ
jgi:hypothetical protein